MGHPAEQVGLPSELLERGHFGVSGAQISEEVAQHDPAVVTPAFGTERCTDGIDRPLKEGSQRM
jgi:glycerol-3-phosphate dehydrogenase